MVDYLSQLHQRPNWCREETNLKLGDMVLVQDDRLLSSKWPYGRVSDVHPGNDGLVRAVSVRTSTGTYKRNVTKIIRLPIAYESYEESSSASKAQIQSAQIHKRHEKMLPRGIVFWVTIRHRGHCRPVI